MVVVPLVLLLFSCLGLNRAPQPAPAKGPGIVVGDVVLDPVAPVFFRFYDTHPLGTVTLISKERTTIRDIKLSFFVKEYMVSPKQCAALAELGPGERRNVDIFALFTNRVLEVTEATNVAADIAIEYRMNGQTYTYVNSVSMRLLDRNAMTLTDFRRLAVFVTA
jgi:hypothetical protein